MKPRAFALHPAARLDLLDVWQLINTNDGEDRADRVVARIEAFCFSLAEFADIGTRHDDRHKGLRSVGVPGVKKGTIVFLVMPERVAVLRIGYLGRNIWANVPDLAANEQISDALKSMRGRARDLRHAALGDGECLEFAHSGRR